MHQNLHDRIVSTLLEASPAFRFPKDDCFIIGAAALVLAGVHLDHTPDIDLLTSRRDAESLLTLWKNKAVPYQPESRELFQSTFGRFRFAQMDIEVMGDLKVNQSGIWNKLQVVDYFSIEIGDVQWKAATLQE